MLNNRRGYSLVLYLLLPFLLLRLAWRGWRQRAYWRHVGERFGFYPQPVTGPVLWLHAVSLGETRAAVPVVRRLLERYPNHRVLITHMTPTGREASLELFGERILRCYLPYDFPFAVRRFLNHFRPRLGLIMETEVWPNLIHECAVRTIPVALINARLSERSFGRYRRRFGLVHDTLGALHGVAAQTEAERQRFLALGARNVAVCGNIKFDLTIADREIELGRTLRERFGGNRFVWVAASTRDGEEQLVLDAFEAARLAGALLVIVPRHPERFNDVAQIIQARGLKFERRSQERPVDPETQVVLGDTMGELLAYYAAADLAFVGGSLLPFGGQNLIEACAMGTPVLVGPHTFNFEEAAHLAVESGAARRVQDANQLGAAVEALAKDQSARAAMREHALTFASAHRGAVERVWAFLGPVLPPRA
jgi:3-deoxy-D-manno-octulosonic-acid transferase